MIRFGDIVEVVCHNGLFRGFLEDVGSGWAIICTRFVVMCNGKIEKDETTLVHCFNVTDVRPT